LPLKKTVSGQESPSGLLKAPLPPVNDSEGQYVPASLPFIVDAHVHFFPDHFFFRRLAMVRPIRLADTVPTDHWKLLTFFFPAVLIIWNEFYGIIPT
jgi:hypothetical protein